MKSQRKDPEGLVLDIKEAKFFLLGLKKGDAIDADVVKYLLTAYDSYLIELEARIDTLIIRNSTLRRRLEDASNTEIKCEEQNEDEYEV